MTKYNMTLRTLLLPLVAILSGVLVFYFLYFHDNKYTYAAQYESSSTALGGVLSISEEDYQKNPLRFLISQWEMYPGVLLSPKDFSHTTPKTYRQYVSIGEFSDMKGGNPYACVKGSATYRLTLFLPDTQRIYALAMPEVFSSYHLYINDSLVQKMGDPYQYKPQIQKQTVLFSAKDKVEILLAVHDGSGIYSGMTYPPAFGDPKELEKMGNKALFFHIFLLVVSVFITILSFVLGLKINRKRSLIFFGLCLCLLGSTTYPLIHTFFPTAIQPWQSIEFFCRYAIYLFIILLHGYLFDFPKKTILITAAPFVLFSILALCLGCFASYLDATAFYGFSKLSMVLKYGMAVYLMISSLHLLRRGNAAIAPLVFASFFYGTSLIADRIGPLYEPILGGWFYEIGGMVLILSLGFVLWIDVYHAYTFKIFFESQQRQMQRQMDMQKEHYQQLSQQIDATHQATHDLRHHMRTLRGLADEGNLSGICDYLEHYGLTCLWEK